MQPDLHGSGIYAAFAEEQKIASELEAIAEAEVARLTPVPPSLALGPSVLTASGTEVSS